MNVKNLTVVAISIVAVGVLVANYIGNFAICGGVEWGQCMDTLASIELTLMIFVAAFPFALVVPLLSRHFFQTWLKFSLIWIPLSIFAVALTPEYRQDFLFGFDKPAVAFYMSLAYVIGSFIAIGYTYFKRK